MDIQGQLKIGVPDDSETMEREWGLSYMAAFKGKQLAQQIFIIQDYLIDIKKEIESRRERGRLRAEMLMVQARGEQLLPYIQAAEMAREKNLLVEIGQNQLPLVTDIHNG